MNAHADANSIGDTLLAVRVGTDLLAIPLSAVEEVLPALPIEAIPQCPPFVRGVVVARGRMIPVVDAAARLGMSDHERPLDPHLVCLRVGERIVGLEVDEATDLVHIRRGEVIAPDDIGAERGFLSGLVERDGKVIRLLDPDRLADGLGPKNCDGAL